MGRHDKRIEALKVKQKQISAQMANLRAKQRTDDRKSDTRRKILAGAVILNQAETNEASRNKLWKLLDQKLDKNRDRELFGLKPRKGSESSRPNNTSAEKDPAPSSRPDRDGD